MSAIPSRFLLSGLASAGLAAGVAFLVHDQVAPMASSLIIAGVLAAGNIAGALWTANDAQGRALDWVRLGLIAAALSFVAIYVIAAPLLTQLPATPQPTLAFWGAIAATVLVTALMVWLSLRLAWRRFAPKDAKR